jgi:hypothetical protein
MNRPEDRIRETTEDIPETELIQADPQLQLSEGRASGLQIALVACACLLVIGVTIFGLGRPATTDGNIMASSPPAQETTGAANPAEPALPQTGGNVPGGENVAPPAAAPQNIPANEPVPQQVKPGVVGDDSAR